MLKMFSTDPKSVDLNSVIELKINQCNFFFESEEFRQNCFDYAGVVSPNVIV